MRKLYDRWSQLDSRIVDRMVAFVLGALLVVMMVGSDEREGPLALNLVGGLTMTTALVSRRRRPLLVAAVVCAAGLAMQLWLTTPPMFPPASFALIVASYSAGTHAEGWRAAAGLALAAGTILLVSIIETPDDIVFPFFAIGVAPWAIGRVLRSQTRLARELSEQEARVTHLRREEQAAAVARERVRVARELHDVLAHNLSVMVIQASGARRAAAREPSTALEAAALIEHTGRDALTELRQLFGPLHHGQGEALDGAVRLAQVADLVNRANRAGLAVTLSVDGDPVPLAAGADAAAYRLVQEALTNALKHAPRARAEVRVSFRPDGVSIKVVNEAPPVRPAPGTVEGSGQGLVGMRERMSLYDGDVEAGPRDDGGFEVNARLPLAGARAAG
jgi:signal transduction histidine kinase